MIPREGLWYEFDEATKQRSMAAGVKKRFSREEYRKIREETNTLFQELTEENKRVCLKRHHMEHPNKIRYVFTSHNGFTDDPQSAFRHIDTIPTLEKDAPLMRLPL